jgi:hypothetical protein
MTTSKGSSGQPVEIATHSAPVLRGHSMPAGSQHARSAKPYEPLPRPVQHRAERVGAKVVMDWKPTPRAHDGALGELVPLSPRLDTLQLTT